MTRCATGANDETRPEFNPYVLPHFNGDASCYLVVTDSRSTFPSMISRYQEDLQAMLPRSLCHRFIRISVEARIVFYLFTIHWRHGFAPHHITAHITFLDLMFLMKRSSTLSKYTHCGYLLQQMHQTLSNSMNSHLLHFLSLYLW